MRARGAIAFAIAGVVATTACSDISRFSTDPGKNSYCGKVTDASFVRAGVPAGTRMRLELDADQLVTPDRPDDVPGHVWTDELSPGEQLTDAPLLVIPQLASDPLSTLGFGEGRVKNALSLTMLNGAQLFVVVSLMQDGDVEVRLIRGTATANVPAGTPTTPSQIFGVFHLHKEDGDCGLH
jgi:hypothetical protein